MTWYPDVADEWHPTKNLPLTLDKVKRFSGMNVWWQCDKGHEWKARVAERTARGTGCPTCGNRVTVIGLNDLKSQYPLIATQLEADVKPEEIYYGSSKIFEWVCDKGHTWKTAVRKRTIYGTGCPYCTNAISKAEQAIYDYLKPLVASIEQNNRTVLAGKELDIYIPDKQIAIEFNGLYWHSEEQGKGRNYHYDKWEACRKKGIQLIQVWEDEWNHNPEKIKSMLAHKLGVSEHQKIAGRDTKIINLTAEQTNMFLKENHIQETAQGSIRVGLVEKQNPDTIVAVMVLKQEPGSNRKVLNLLRYATSVNVRGGFTKLLTFAEKTYTPDSIITFSDNCVSDGGLYENNGFVNVKTLPPDYKYVVKGERVHKFRYRLKRFKTDVNLIFEDDLSERELALLNGLPRIWDAGKTKWERKVPDSFERQRNNF